MTTDTATATTQVYRVWIKATAERIWAAITDPEWNNRYGYAAPSFYELKAGGRYNATANQGMKDYGKQMGFEVPDTSADLTTTGNSPAAKSCCPLAPNTAVLRGLPPVSAWVPVSDSGNASAPNCTVDLLRV